MSKTRTEVGDVQDTTKVGLAYLHQATKIGPYGGVTEISKAKMPSLLSVALGSPGLIITLETGTHIVPWASVKVCSLK